MGGRITECKEALDGYARYARTKFVTALEASENPKPIITCGNAKNEPTGDILSFGSILLIICGDRIVSYR